jgi:hypothetical protein
MQFKFWILFFYCSLDFRFTLIIEKVEETTGKQITGSEVETWKNGRKGRSVFL